MDWASSQWKQELPPSAIQKIDALEGKIERLQKERQQKQLQCECLELALEKEKRKVENEKQQTIASQRELQSFADICKDFENKQQRLQNEIQNRDNRIVSLEGLLSQAKKENCRLQQVENDLKELRSLREASLLEKEQTNESFNSGQNVKLQEKKVNLLSESQNENSERSILAEKDNNKYTLNESSQLSSLMKKISDQEKIIQELKLKLLSMSVDESNKECHHVTDSKTPGRLQMEPVEASPVFKIKSVWDSFTSTPAKENKETVLRHHSDSITISSSDEKLKALQTRLKQLCQELDCQRHNYEASKVSLEQKFKEKENELKAELKYQAQANADLDKELKDLKNKYQQDITQSTKKMDILAAQLKKTEEAKTILEKEVKDMASKISAFTLNLKTKEEEIQNLQKLKSSTETTIQSLQVQVRDLESKYKNVEKENSTLSESIKAVELQLDGSCNLAQEREADLTKIKKELENLSLLYKNLLNENQDLQNRTTADQRKLEELLQNETVLKENVELMEKEQNQLTEKLNVEMKKSQGLAFTMEAQKSQIFSQKEEFSLMESKLTQLNQEFADTKLNFEEKICNLSVKLNHFEKENAGLINQLKECSCRENLLIEKLERTENEKTELMNKLLNETEKLQKSEINMAEHKQVNSDLREELSHELAKNNELKIQLSASERENEAKIQEMQMKLNAGQEEYDSLEKKLDEYSTAESSLKQGLEQMSNEKEEMVSQLAAEKNLRLNLESSTVELNDKIKLLEEERACESLKYEELQRRFTNLQIELEAKIQELQMKLNVAQEEYDSLEKKLDEYSTAESSLKQGLEQISNEKKEMVSHLAAEKNLRLNLESSTVELNDKIKLLEEERACESLKYEELQQRFTNLQIELEAKIQELEIKLNAAEEEYVSLENKLEEYSTVESSFKQELEQISNEKAEVVSELATEKILRLNLESSTVELNDKIKLLEEERACKSLESDELKKKITNLQIEHECIAQELEMKLNAAQKEYANLEKKLEEYSTAESSLRQELKQMSNEKEEAVSQITSEKSLKLNLESSIGDLSNKIKFLEEETVAESLNSNELKKTITNLEIEHKAEIQELEIKLNAVQKEYDSLEMKFKEISTAASSLNQELECMGNEKGEVLSQFTSEKSLRLNLESSIVELNNKIKLLEEEKSCESLESDELKKSVINLKIEYEAKIQQLQMNLSAAQKEYASFENKIKEYLTAESSLKRELQQIINEKEEAVSQVTAEKSLRLNLESSIVELNNEIKLLEEERARACLQSDKLEEKIANLQIEHEELEMKLNAALEVYARIENKLKEYSVIESSLKQELQQMTYEKEKAVSQVTAEKSLRLDLESAIVELNNKIKLLEDERACESLESGELKKKIANLQIEHEELKLKLNAAQEVYSRIENKFMEYSTTESSLIQKLELMKNEKEEAVSQVTTEKSLRLNLESSILDLNNKIKLLEQERACESLESDELKKKIANLQIELQSITQELEIKLNIAQEDNDDLKKKFNEYSTVESSLKQELEQMSSEKEEAVTQVIAEKSLRLNLESSIGKLSDKIKLLEEERACESLESDELKKNITNLQIEYEEQLNNMSEKENSLLQEVNSLKKEKDSLGKELDSGKYELLKVQASSNELELNIQTLNDELTQKSSELDKIKNHVMSLQKEYMAKVEKQENQPLHSSREMLGGISKLLNLDEKVGSCHFSKLEADISLGTFEFDEISIENETLKEKCQELQAEVSGVRSENVLLSVKMKDSLLNAEMLQKRLELVKKEKQDLDKQLNFENRKIKMLESGIQELKKIILTLQVLLISYNGDIKGLNPEIAGSKDSSEFKDGVKFKSFAAVKKCMPTTGAETQSFPSFYFPEFKFFSSLPEKDFSAALEKFSFYSLNQICCLENSLKSKLERCKFLCNYQLVDKMQLNKVWKIFVFLRRKLNHIQLLKKFMVCFCNILKSSLVAHILLSVNEVALVKVFPENFDFTLKDFLYLCNNAFNKILFSVSQTFEKDMSLVNQHSVFLNKHSNIHNSAFHLPVIKNTNFVLCRARFRRLPSALKPMPVVAPKLNNIFSARRQNIKKALKTLNAQEAPFFLNFTMSLFEDFEKRFGHSSKDFTSGNFSMSALQMKNYLSLLEPSTPIFQVLSKYCIDILNLENVAVHDICYWKHHCNILGIEKCNVQKMITLLEHMDKHRISESDLVNTGSRNQHAKEVTAQKNEKCLDEYLKIEKEKQKSLNIAIEEIEKDLGETFLLKEKFKNMASNVGKMLLSIKKSDTENFLFSNIQLDKEEISTETCFCEDCIMDESVSDRPSHDQLTLDYYLKFIDRLISSGRQLEELKRDESELKALCRILKDKNSELELTVDQCNRNLEMANYQVQNLKLDIQAQKEKYEYLSQSANEKDTLNMHLEAENRRVLISNDEYKSQLKVLGEVKKLSGNQEKFEFKDKEIALLKVTVSENVHLLNESQMKCKEYRNEIDLLNSRILKYEEEKMIDQHTISRNTSHSLDESIKSSKTYINELQAKIDSLTKSNNSLNLTIENIEEELQNVFMEKKNAIEKLDKLSEETCLKQDISASSQKYNDEKRSNETLFLKLKEYEKIMLDNENIIKQLKNKIETLKKNDSLIKSVTKEHEQVLFKKNSDLTRCHQVIKQLQTQNEELTKENSDLKVQIGVSKKQESLTCQLNKIMCLKSELEKEIKILETEKVQNSEKLSEANLLTKNLNECLQQLALELKIEKDKNTDLERKCNELSSSLNCAINSNTSKEEELNKHKNQLSILNKQLEESSVELKKISCANYELITEVSTLKSVEKQLTQKIETLADSLKDADDKVKAESNKTQLLIRENETLKKNVNANISSEFQKLRNTLNGAYNFIVNVLNIVLCAVQNYPEHTDFEELKSSLSSIICHCKKNSEKELQSDLINLLSSFFGMLIGNHKDDLVICGLVSSIKDTLKNIAAIDESCPVAEASLVISPNTICNMSHDSSFFRQANSHSNIVTDLQFIKAQTDDIIFNLKKIISKKDEEIEKLRNELKQLPSIKAKNDSELKESDKGSFKWKYEFVMRQYRRLEEKYNVVVTSSEQMEKEIKKLQEENKNLDKEAEDLSNEIKNMEAYYSSSDELLVTLEELNALRPKLEGLQRENDCLKRKIQELQSQLQQTSVEKASSSPEINALRHKLKELDNENNSLKKRFQEFQLQQASAKKTPPAIQKQTQIPKFDKMHLKENNVDRFMKGS